LYQLSVKTKVNKIMYSFKKKEIIYETVTFKEHFLAKNWVGMSKDQVIEEMTKDFPFIKYIMYLLRADDTAILFDDEYFFSTNLIKFVFDNSWICVKVEF